MDPARAGRLFLGDDSKLYEGLTDRWLDEGVVAALAAGLLFVLPIDWAGAVGVNPVIPAMAAIFGADYVFMLPVSTRPTPSSRLDRTTLAI